MVNTMALMIYIIPTKKSHLVVAIIHMMYEKETMHQEDNTVSLTNKERWWRYTYTCQTKNDDTYTWAISNSANTMSNRST